MSETVKPVTNCPVCGAECKVGGEETHYYIPQYTYSESEVRELLHKTASRFLCCYNEKSLNEWFNEHKKNRL